MMQLEKRLSQADLSPFKDTKEKIMARSIIQYQDFRTEIALEKMNYIGYAESTARVLFNTGVRYIKSGKLPERENGFKKVREYINELKPKYTPLRPKDSERSTRTLRQNNYNRKPKQKEPVIEATVPKITEKFNYGLNIDGKFQIFNTEFERACYLKAISDFKIPVEYKLCHVKVDYEV